jgi:HSP20 family molecular chaperone IbpA
MLSRIVFLVALVQWGFCGDNKIEFDWEEKGGGNSNTTQQSPVPSSKLAPSPSLPQGQNFPGTMPAPFSKFHSIMEQMRQQMDNHFSNIFQSDPFFNSNGGRGSMLPGQGFMQPFSQGMSSMMGGAGLKVMEKNNYVIVEVPAENADVSDFNIQLNGQFLTIEQTTQSKRENNSQNSYQHFSSYSSSSRSTSLPVPVEPDYSKSIVNGKLILTFKKRS